MGVSEVVVLDIVGNGFDGKKPWLARERKGRENTVERWFVGEEIPIRFAS